MLIDFTGQICSSKKVFTKKGNPTVSLAG